MSWHLLQPEGRPPPAAGVAEFQGLYGAYSFSEKLLQKIWLRGEFDRANLVTLDGRRLSVRHPGKWNLLGGPDFKGARLSFDGGPEVTGEVELHLRAESWAEHGHAADRAYDGVVLHVVLFPPDPGHVTRTAHGQSLAVLALLPLLNHDLEQFAAEEAVEALANRPASRIQDELGRHSRDELAGLLRRHAERRWRQKVHFAQVRVQRLGWEAACHQAALEILGYRFNRAPMLRLAAAWPLGCWAQGVLEVERLVGAEETAWSLQGVRPANHPRLRLRQYAAWTQARADWPARLATLGRVWPVLPLAATTGTTRATHRLAALRQGLAIEICAAAVGGTRLDNLVCDGFLPLVAAASGRDLGGMWFHWYPGDWPPTLRRALRNLGATGGRGQPFAHGLGQGLFGWMLEQEAQR